MGRIDDGSGNFIVIRRRCRGGEEEAKLTLAVRIVLVVVIVTVAVILGPATGRIIVVAVAVMMGVAVVVIAMVMVLTAMQGDRVGLRLVGGHVLEQVVRKLHATACHEAEGDQEPKMADSAHHSSPRLEALRGGRQGSGRNFPEFGALSLPPPGPVPACEREPMTLIITTTHD